jgi:PAS domain S-box-containing protein
LTMGSFGAHPHLAGRAAKHEHNIFARIFYEGTLPERAPNQAAKGATMSESLALGADAVVTNTYALNERAHLVQFYEHEDFLLDEVTRFVGAGLGAGDAVVVIATKPHLDGLTKCLKARGVDIAMAWQQGRYIPLDAVETLAKLMVKGSVDGERFAEVVGGTIARAAKSHAHVRAFGEMVALLWTQGKREEALRLEGLWNDVARTRPFSLLCAYPMPAFGDARDGTPLLRICEAHSGVIPAESYTAMVGSNDRLRAITMLQQKSLALDTEVAERNQQQRRAEEVQARLAAIVESSDDAIIGKTLDGIITSWNAGATRIFGYTAEEMIGKPISWLVPPDRQGDVATILGAVRGGQRIEHFETERIRKDGRRIHVSVTVSPIRDADGRIVGASKVARDVTERHRAEEAKEEFLAMLGHELRNPLAAMQSAIIAARLDESRREVALDIARRQGAQLRRIVDDLLDVSRVTGGKIALRKEQLFLATVVERALDATRTTIEERGQTLAVALPSEIKVEADADRLEQVLVNLLINAAKYTPPGGHIEVSAEVLGEEIVLRVRDNGVGIDAETLPYVFDLFAQADKSLDRAQGGLGIGLALVRRLVELHGGRVEARSAGYGQGAEFLVRLPAPHSQEPRRADAGEVSAAEPQAGTRARVLLVEDNVDAADALAMLLEVLGHSVEVAHDGPEALEAVQRAHPDVVLVDIGLPSMDGFEVARRLRAAQTGNLLLVALTGYGRDEDRERTRAAGFDFHLTKPVEKDALEGLVARFGVARPEKPSPPNSAAAR